MGRSRRLIACVSVLVTVAAVLLLLLRSSPGDPAPYIPLVRTYDVDRRAWNSENACSRLLDESRDIPNPELSVSACVHLLRLHGSHAEVQINGDIVHVLSLLTDARIGSRFLGQPAFVRTAVGVRFPVMVKNGTLSGIFDDAHRDLCLACFAELGLPLDFPLITSSGDPLELRLAVIDAIATFHLTQQELEWTAIAFAHYILDGSWTNRFGEITTFDDLARKLLSRQLRKSSCGGAHRLRALSQLLIADSERHILSADVRGKILNYLTDVVEILQQTQSPTGFWTTDWTLLVDAPGSPQIVSTTVDTQSSRLLVTGHLAEWLRTLPLELDASAVVLSRSRTWLLSQINGSSRFWDNCCPWTHALCAVSD